MISPVRRAAVYLRISFDQTGEGLAVARQRAQCAQIIEQRGWKLVEEFVDNSISASDARKNRPGYDALVKAYEAGQFNALVTYDLDRLTRQPRQLEDWIDAAEGRGLAVVTANGEADLTTDGGRLFARMKLAVARSEVERKSARQKVAAHQRAQLGRPPLGVRLTGYTAKGETIPDEADVVRRMFKMFDAGESLRSIARQLTDEGVHTRHGKAWNPSTVRDILTNPRYAGRAVYDGKPTGERGQWEALVTDDVFDAIQNRLSDPLRRTNRVGTDRRHLGSGLFLCAACGEPVSGWSQGRYRCKERHVNRARGPVDAWVREVIAARLRREDMVDLLAPAQADLAPLLNEAERLRNRLAATAADYDADRIDGHRYFTKTQAIKAELKGVESQLAAHRTGPALGDVLGAPDPAQAFLDSTLMAQRAVIAALCTVRLHKGTRGSRTFDYATVTVEPKQ
ncbi:serine recombinase [Mycolicibacterium litorale]|uniref:Serine recombinase n=1 Tax=Mycolicibacterium litorale TaxID=758802 RepID=A0A6S6PAG6_9MYCO|nr:recombinase family protein [Mycolicibacterium litorale]BCI54681.1 serine recombinase [Mycolicibacterium litorale]